VGLDERNGDGEFARLPAGAAGTLLEIHAAYLSGLR